MQEDPTLQSQLYRLMDAEYKEQLLAHYPADARPVIGVPLSNLFEMARENAGVRDREALVKRELTDQTYDEVLLKAWILGSNYASFDDATRLLERFLAKMDSPQLCDAICLAFRIAIEYPNETLDLIERRYLNSEKGFEQRYALVTLLDYYVNSDHIDRLLRLLAAVETLTPQAEDALAWAYQTCFLGFQQKTFFALRALKVEKESFNRMLDRILTCTRFNETQQQVLLTLRRP